MANNPLLASKAVTATNDATDWVLIQPGDALAISIPTGITGTVNVERSLDNSAAEGVLAAQDGTTNFATGAQLTYKSDVSEWIRIKAALVSSGSATVKIKRN